MCPLGAVVTLVGAISVLGLDKAGLPQDERQVGNGRQ